MLKKTYRVLIILGICIGVTAGIFFLCSVQNQLRTQAEEEAIRRQSEQNGRVYLSIRDVPDNAVFSLSSMRPEQYEKAAELFPKDWAFAPVMEKNPPTEIAANDTVIAGAAIYYSTPNYFEVTGARLLEGSFPADAQSCVASISFLEEFGLDMKKQPTVTVNGKQLKITGTFQLPGEQSVDSSFYSDQNTGLRLLASYPHHREEAGIWGNQITIKKPKDLTLEEFEKQLSQLEETLNAVLPEEDTVYTARSDAALYQEFWVGNNSESLIYLGMFLLTFLGEFVAGINMMHLASAGILENRQKIGIKLAMGASHGDLFREFAGEIMLLCGKGALLGLALSAPLVYLMNRWLEDFVFLFDSTTVLMAVAVILCVSLLSSYFPFRYVLKQQPARLMKEGG